MSRNMIRRSSRQKGATVIEYILVLVFVAITAVGLFQTLGKSVRDKMNNEVQPNVNGITHQ